MGVPGFLLRKLYKRRSLTHIDDERFSFTLQNPLATTTLVSPPRITVNGVNHDAKNIDAGHVNLANISERKPFVFKRGTEIQLVFQGQLMKSNRIHIRVDTKEFDDVDFLVEDRLTTSGDEEE